MARSPLVEELMGYRGRGLVVAAAGACDTCILCGAKAGSTECHRPNVRIYSLDSLGVIVVRLLSAAFGSDPEWTSGDRAADFVCAIGAVFFTRPWIEQRLTGVPGSTSGP